MLERLNEVLDPELDESIVTLGVSDAAEFDCMTDDELHAFHRWANKILASLKH